MTTITAKYAGHLRCEAQHAPSGNTLITDAPTDNAGKGEAFSPTDLLATALITCMLTIMGIQAQKMRKELQAHGEVHKHMRANPRHIGKLEVTLWAETGAFTPEQKQLLEQAARACPVAMSLLEDTEQDVQIVWH